MSKTVTLLRSENRLVVDPTTPEIFTALSQELSFTAKKMLYGAEAFKAGTSIEFTNYKCYVPDHRHRIATNIGFHDRIVSRLEKMGFSAVMEDLSPHPNPALLEPLWDRLYDPERKIELRHGQEEFLARLSVLVRTRMPGCFDCAPGYGKSFLIGLVGLLYPKLKIHVVSKRVPVLCDRIYPELCQMLPNVGICGGGQKKMGCRVMCFTADSLTHSNGDADILIIDEVHESAADRYSERLARYTRSTNIGLSATHDMRLDNKNLRVEGMFGPVVFTVSYDEAAAHGMVVPIEVIWSDVITDSNPCDPTATSIQRKRMGIWRNQIRNQIIANDAESYGDDVQRLITCETIEHALFLKYLLPDYELVYAQNGIKRDDVEYFKRLGVWPEGHEIMTLERRQALTKRFERGVLKKAIATTVWNVGVSFNFLQVLLRADAGASPTMDTQIPGRTSRLNADGGKECGIVHDYLDQFDRGFESRAKGRQKSYAAQKWKQIFPNR